MPKTSAACSDVNCLAVARVIASRRVIARASRRTCPLDFFHRAAVPDRADIFKCLYPGHFQCL
jgi:hypothetical protein